MRTLIVEDDKTSSQLLQAVLESEGYETTVVEGGREALLALESQKADCIVSDVMMPNIDGFRLVYKVKKSERFKNIPFIMYTAGIASDDDEQFAISLGVDKYIRKPGSTKEIVKAIRDIFVPSVMAGKEVIRSARDKWVMEKYGKFLLDKLENKIEELEQIKIKLELNEIELKKYNEDLELRVENRTRELQLALKTEKELVLLKSRFISIVSHEFRTPLTSINFQAGIIKMHSRKLPWREIQERMDSIKHQIIHMTELLDDLLTMGQAEAGKIKVINSEVDGPAFFNEIVTEIMHSTNNTHVIYPHINIPQGKITADIRLLRNIVINLLCNAVKYSPARKPIHFTVVRKDTNLIMEVKDSGIGIDGGDLDTIFNSFTRGKNVGKIQGTGLGLSIVQKAVEVLSGYVSVKSRLNEGSVFNVNIPLG